MGKDRGPCDLQVWCLDCDVMAGACAAYQTRSKVIDQIEGIWDVHTGTARHLLGRCNGCQEAGCWEASVIQIYCAACQLIPGCFSGNQSFDTIIDQIGTLWDLHAATVRHARHASQAVPVRAHVERG